MITRKEKFYLMTHSHFIYGYMASDIWLRTIRIMRKEIRCHHRLLFLINSKGSFICTIHRQDCTYHGLCYTSRGVLAGTRHKSKLLLYSSGVKPLHVHSLVYMFGILLLVSSKAKCTYIYNTTFDNTNLSKNTYFYVHLQASCKPLPDRLLSAWR